MNPDGYVHFPKEYVNQTNKPYSLSSYESY